jgi:hypothetical protein
VRWQVAAIFAVMGQGTIMDSAPAGEPETQTAKKTAWQRVERFVWAFLAAITLVGAVSGAFDMLDWVERIIQGWRTFLHSLFRGLIDLLPDWLRLYDAPPTYDGIIVMGLLLGGYFRSTQVPDDSVWSQRLNMLSLAVIAVSLGLAALDNDEPSRMRELVWAYTAVGVGIPPIYFLATGGANDISSRFWRWSARVVFFAFGVVPPLFLASIFVFEYGWELYPITIAEWRAVATALLIWLPITVLYFMTTRRGGMPFFQVLCIALAILALGWLTPVIQHAMTDAGWTPKD